MNEGKKFEQDFKKSLEDYKIWHYRIKDSSSSWSNDKNSRFTSKEICDYIVFEGRILYLVELKSHLGNSLPFTAIRENQLEGLCNINANFVLSYFIINMRDKEKTYAIKASTVKEYIDTADRGRIPISFMESNGILIPQQRKITRYKYDVMKFFGNEE